MSTKKNITYAVYDPPSGSFSRQYISLEELMQEICNDPLLSEEDASLEDCQICEIKTLPRKFSWKLELK